jgi:hypothetical protein
MNFGLSSILDMIHLGFYYRLSSLGFCIIIIIITIIKFFMVFFHLISTLGDGVFYMVPSYLFLFSLFFRRVKVFCILKCLEYLASIGLRFGFFCD